MDCLLVWGIKKGAVRPPPSAVIPVNSIGETTAVSGSALDWHDQLKEFVIGVGLGVSGFQPQASH
ncbi:MAG: hypothetical protein ACJA04_000775 [Cellvibrionaceae bacterium]|jgi:hypothetical protein